MRWSRAAYAYATCIALGLAYFIARIPIQIDDCVGNLINVLNQDFWTLVGNQFVSAAYLRPLLWAQLDVSFELANGHYLLMYKGIHTAQVLATAWLFVHLLRVRTAVGAFTVPLGIAILFGAHTFGGTIHEGYPINTHLTIVICCLMTAVLVTGPLAMWRSIAALVLFLFGSLTVETGLLVWVIVTAGWLAGARGVSGRGVAVVTLALVGYVFLRLGPLNVGVPNLLERSAGYGFGVLEPDQLAARFGTSAWRFYAYNVLSQIVSVLLSEPRNGVYQFTRDVLGDGAKLNQIIPVTTAAVTTTLIIGYVVARRRAIRQWRLAHEDQLVFIFLGVLCANAVISYPYAKDVVMSSAGVFYALAATIATTYAVSALGRRHVVTGLAGGLALAVVSIGWAVSLIGIHYNLREKAFIVRNDWMSVYEGGRLGSNAAEPRAAALVKQLRDQALSTPTVPPRLANPELSQYFQQPW